MSNLPCISGQKCIKALSKADFYFKRQQGSHIILRRDNPFAQVVVPDHKELDRGTLRAVIHQVGLSVDEFVRLLSDQLITSRLPDICRCEVYTKKVASVILTALS